MSGECNLLFSITYSLFPVLLIPYYLYWFSLFLISNKESFLFCIEQQDRNNHEDYASQYVQHSLQMFHRVGETLRLVCRFLHDECYAKHGQCSSNGKDWRNE